MSEVKWTPAEYGTALTLQVGIFRFVVRQPIMARGDIAYWRASLTCNALLVKQFETSEDAQAAAIAYARRKLAEALAELNALEGGAK